MNEQRAAPAGAWVERFKVRYRDTDAQGHLYFANYLVYADEAAGNYMTDLGFDWSNPERTPCLVFTANISCDYLAECRNGDHVRAEVAYARLGNKSARVDFALFRDECGTALARGSISQVFVGRDTRRPIAMPDSVRTAITARHPALAAGS
jgi:acyl-CoA thioester hydrolase